MPVLGRGSRATSLVALLVLLTIAMVGCRAGETSSGAVTTKSRRYIVALASSDYGALRRLTGFDLKTRVWQRERESVFGTGTITGLRVLLTSEPRREEFPRLDPGAAADEKDIIYFTDMRVRYMRNGEQAQQDVYVEAAVERDGGLSVGPADRLTP